eukprot:GHVN01063215.1.p1 GENE.GHVN01063215.1~~GHVN01063215.1.p1  ORF type:complete len:1066 (-),score=220.89 GHVN01063215.1:261-3056(-)
MYLISLLNDEVSYETKRSIEIALLLSLELQSINGFHLDSKEYLARYAEGIIRHARGEQKTEDGEGDEAGGNLGNRRVHAHPLWLVAAGRSYLLDSKQQSCLLSNSHITTHHNTSQHITTHHNTSQQSNRQPYLSHIQTAAKQPYLHSATQCFKAFRSFVSEQVRDRWLNEEEVKLSDGGEEEIKTQKLEIEEKWRAAKTSVLTIGLNTDSMDEMMKLVELWKVKLYFINLFNMAVDAHITSAQLPPASNFNFVLNGNPRTGKTARLFANVLSDTKSPKKSELSEVTAQQLIDDGIDKFKQMLVNSPRSGVLFIDDASQLFDPVLNDARGEAIVAEMVTHVENDRADVTEILSGYRDEIEVKLYAFDAVINAVVEKELDDDMWKAGMERSKKIRGEDECNFGGVVSKRLIMGEKSKRVDDATAMRRKMVELDAELLPVLIEMNDKIGWDTVNDSIVNLITAIQENKVRELKGQPAVRVSVNRLFLGNPGTGKSKCAEVYGKMLKQCGVLSSGEVVVKRASDFTCGNADLTSDFTCGNYDGKTEQTEASGKGKVLVIDDAMNFDDEVDGRRTLDLIVENLTVDGQDRAVVLVGDERQMKEMIRNQNPGLRRHFPIEEAFFFEDLSDKDLLVLLVRQFGKCKIRTESLDVIEFILQILKSQKSMPNFANARAVEQLVKNAQMSHLHRCVIDDDDDNKGVESRDVVLTIEDFEEASGYKRYPLLSSSSSILWEEESDREMFNEIDHLVNVDHIREMMKAIFVYHNAGVVDRERSDVVRGEGMGHFIFKGPPGTGKTTVARAMGKIFLRMGLVVSDKVFETSGNSLMAEHGGEAGNGVLSDILEDDRGGIFFIHHPLGETNLEWERNVHSWGEAIESILELIMLKEFKNIIVILSGTTYEMDLVMLSMSPRLRSRFYHRIEFKEWRAKETSTESWD